MAFREFLQLANTFEFGKHCIGGYYMSEKLDGIRCYWDGGITIGMACAEVPWANVAKHYRFVNEQFSTGLWTRYGHPLRCPNWWSETLPKCPLDGELYLGVGSWQELSSIVKNHYGDMRWKGVRYVVFDSPTYEAVFANGEIRGTNYKKVFTGIPDWIIGRGIKKNGVNGVFYQVLRALEGMDFGEYGKLHPQVELPMGFTEAEKVVRSTCDLVCSAKGEGLILRDPMGIWTPKRNNNLLKVKGVEDAEGTVVGYKFAKPTDLSKSVSGNQTDKLLGLMGSMRLRLDTGVEFDLSGFTDAERQMSAFEYGVEHPGEDVPNWIENPKFPRGTRVTFQYRELSKDGLPKEARYFRKTELT